MAPLSTPIRLAEQEDPNPNQQMPELPQVDPIPFSRRMAYELMELITDAQDLDPRSFEELMEYGDNASDIIFRSRPFIEEYLERNMVVFQSQYYRSFCLWYRDRTPDLHFISKAIDSTIDEIVRDILVEVLQQEPEYQSRYSWVEECGILLNCNHSHTAQYLELYLHSVEGTLLGRYLKKGLFHKISYHQEDIILELRSVLDPVIRTMPRINNGRFAAQLLEQALDCVPELENLQENRMLALVPWLEVLLISNFPHQWMSPDTVEEFWQQYPCYLQQLRDKVASLQEYQVQVGFLPDHILLRQAERSLTFSHLMRDASFKPHYRVLISRLESHLLQDLNGTRNDTNTNRNKRGWRDIPRTQLEEIFATAFDLITSFYVVDPEVTLETTKSEVRGLVSRGMKLIHPILDSETIESRVEELLESHEEEYHQLPQSDAGEGRYKRYRNSNLIQEYRNQICRDLEYLSFFKACSSIISSLVLPLLEMLEDWKDLVTVISEAADSKSVHHSKYVRMMRVIWDLLQERELESELMPESVAKMVVVNRSIVMADFLNIQ